MSIFNRKQPEPIKPEKEGCVIGKQLCVQDIVGFFKYDIGTSYVDGKIEGEVALIRKQQRSVPFQWVFALAVIIIVGVIAYSILQQQLSNNQCVSALANLAGGAVNRASGAVGGIAGSINSTMSGIAVR